MAAELIPRGDGRSGTYAPWIAHTADPEYKPYWTATTSCPNCKARMTLARHTIAPDGTVSPSIGHPEGIADCGWHPSSGKLVGWEAVIAQPLPQPPPIETCARCGHQARSIGGWGTWGQPGIICDKCVKEVRTSGVDLPAGTRGPDCAIQCANGVNCPLGTCARTSGVKGTGGGQT